MNPLTPVARLGFIRMIDSVAARIFCTIIVLLLAMASVHVQAQVLRVADPNDAGSNKGSNATHITLSPETNSENGSLRRSLLIGGVAASMAAYGYFTLEFNNSRGDAIDAERAYEADVRQNAQTYVDQGIALDQIQTFRDWQKAFDDADSSREWGARAGLMAIVIGFFAVVDASTSYDGPSPRLSEVKVRPTVGLTAASRDLVVGARMKF